MTTVKLKWGANWESESERKVEEEENENKVENTKKAIFLKKKKEVKRLNTSTNINSIFVLFLELCVIDSNRFWFLFFIRMISPSIALNLNSISIIFNYFPNTNMFILTVCMIWNKSSHSNEIWWAICSDINFANAWIIILLIDDNRVLHVQIYKREYSHCILKIFD